MCDVKAFFGGDKLGALFTVIEKVPARDLEGRLIGLSPELAKNTRSPKLSSHNRSHSSM